MEMRCPKCGGTTIVEREAWSRGSARLVRLSHCEACGTESRRELPWGRVPPSQMRRDGRGMRRSGLWLVAALAAIWITLNVTDFGARSLVYRMLTRTAEGFRHPGWIAALILAAILILLAGRRRARRPVLDAVLAPDVHIRAEPKGKLSLVFTGSRDAIAQDYVIDRRDEDEQRLLSELDALARRSATFEADDGLPSADEIAETHRRVYAIGRSLASILGGDEDGGAMEQLVDLQGDHLLLRVQRELSAFPWELLVPKSGGQPLWQLYCVSRQIRADGRREAVWHRPVGPLRMLLIADVEHGDHGRDLPQAEREAQEILELGALKPELLRVVRRSPRDLSELAAAINEGYDIIHYAGHTGRDESGAVGWVLPSGEIADGRNLFSPATTPILVFSNACGEAARVSVGGNGLALSFAEGGVPIYLGTLWELHDAGSAAFALAFYRSILSGDTLGAAVRSARERSFRFHAFSWANYILYGDPTTRLID